jgi:hypothetical protein
MSGDVYSLTNVQFAIKISNLKKKYWVIRPLVSPEMLSDFLRYEIPLITNELVNSTINDPVYYSMT